MDIDYLGFIGACHSNTHVIVHPVDLPDRAWLVLPICSNCWQNHARKVHFLSDTEGVAPTAFKSLPAWDLGSWIPLSSLAELSQHLWAQPGFFLYVCVCMCFSFVCLFLCFLGGKCWFFILHFGLLVWFCLFVCFFIFFLNWYNIKAKCCYHLGRVSILRHWWDTRYSWDCRCWRRHWAIRVSTTAVCQQTQIQLEDVIATISSFLFKILQLNILYFSTAMILFQRCNIRTKGPKDKPQILHLTLIKPPFL